MSSRIDLLSPISVIKGFGEKRIAALYQSNIFTIADFLYRLPRKYVDRTTPLSQESSNNDTTQSKSHYPFEPHYSLTQIMRSANIDQKRLRDAVSWLFTKDIHFPEKLPALIEERYNFPSLRDALYNLHFPKNLSEKQYWVQRIKYEELYQTALNLRWLQRDFTLPGVKMRSDTFRDKFTESLPFTLTNSQQEIIDQLATISESPNRMHHLLQGDIGCGKTVVAFIATLPALEKEFQCAWVSSTEVIAQQSFYQIKQWLEPFNIEPVLLTESTSTKEKRAIVHGLKTGTIQFVISTDTLLQHTISFDKLRMIVVDSLLRFSTKQRLILQLKAPSSDFLMVSANPIPQQLTTTLYRDLTVLTITDTPVDHSLIHTHLVAEEKRDDMEQFIRSHVRENSEQLVLIIPELESTDDTFNAFANLEQCHRHLSTELFSPNEVAVIHSGMSNFEKLSALERFSNGSISILIATTVDDIGINSAHASMMIIEQSDQFGLTQLHRLRRKIGRNGHDSWVFLLGSQSLSETSIDHLKQFAKTNDGFEIVKQDYAIRETDASMELYQNGISELQFSNMLYDEELFQQVQSDIEQILQPE